MPEPGLGANSEADLPKETPDLPEGSLAGSRRLAQTTCGGADDARPEGGEPDEGPDLESVRLGTAGRHNARPDYLGWTARRGQHRAPTCGEADDAGPEGGEPGEGPDLGAAIDEEGADRRPTCGRKG